MTVRFTESHSFGSLGSNTTQLVPDEDRLLDVVEQPADVEVAPLGIARQRAGAPHADALAGEGPDAVDAVGLSWSCSPLVICSSRRDRAADDLVGRRLVHATGVVVAGPDAGHVAGRRDEARPGPASGSITLTHGQ